MILNRARVWPLVMGVLLLPALALAGGHLIVASYPAGAQIWLDGDETAAATPDTLRDIPAGYHVLLLKLAGFTNAYREVVVTDGATEAITIFLERAEQRPHVQREIAPQVEELRVEVNREPGRKAATFGFRAGLGSHGVTYDPQFVRTTRRTGWLVGAFYERRLTSGGGLTFRPELTLVDKGWVEHRGDAARSIHSVELALAPVLTLGRRMGKAFPFATVGAELSLNAGARFRDPGNPYVRQYSGYEATGLSANYGVGLAIQRGTGDLLFEARYNHGLLNMFDRNLATSSTAAARIHGLQFMVGYQLATRFSD